MMMVSVGDAETGRKLSQRAAERLPDIAAPRNNLAQSYALEGDLDEALRVGQETVERFPNNLHARCNLIEFLFRTGKHAEAEALAAPLRGTLPERGDDWRKLIEMFSYLGDNAAILDQYRLYQDKYGQKEPIDPHTLHLVAVALARSGDEKQARRLWKQALNDMPGLQTARDNLADLDQKPGKRHGAWAFPFQHWVPSKWIERLLKIALRRGEGVFQREARKTVAELPELQAALPILLERGDPPGREFALQIASVVPFEGLRDFVLSPYGTDDDRMRASQFAVEYGLLPRGQPLPMYQGGKQQELLLLNYEINDKRERPRIPKAVQRLYEQSAEAYHSSSYEEALRLAQEALALAPDAPPLMNMVAVSLQALERTDEMEAMMRRTVELHPDYLFARCGMAQLCVKEGKLDEADEWIKPLMERAEFHHSEFAALSAAYIAVLEAKGLIDGALSWLNMWEQMDPDAPQIAALRGRLNLKKGMSRLFGKAEQK
jgi:tetratricopeptide (TPR) repeat protein